MNIDKVFEFIKDKRGYKTPFMYKLINGLPLSEDELTFEDNLDLQYTDVSFLPDNLYVKGWLDLRDTKITSLPDNLRVNGSIFITNLNISEIPNKLKFHGNFYIANTPLEEKYYPNEITKMIKDKGGYFYGDVLSI